MPIPVSQLPPDLVWQGQLDISNPIKKTKYEQLNREWEASRGGVQGRAPTIGGYDPIGLARQMQQFQVEAAQPAIASLQAGVPEVTAAYGAERERLAGEKEPLKARYDRLLEDITKRTETATAREFGERRGIPLSSGIYETALAERIEPQRERVGLEREAGLRDIDKYISQLTTQETAQKRDIQNAIAQLQSGHPQSAIQGALSLLQMQQGAQQFTAQQAARAGEFEQQMGLSRAQMAQQQSQFEAEQRRLAAAPRGTYEERMRPVAQQAYESASRGVTLADLQRQFGAQLGSDEVVRAYAAASPYGAPHEPYARRILGLEQITEEEKEEVAAEPKTGILRSIWNWATQ